MVILSMEVLAPGNEVGEKIGNPTQDGSSKNGESATAPAPASPAPAPKPLATNYGRIIFFWFDYS